MKKTLHTTLALCPQCLTELEARVYTEGESAVWMERTCPDHGRTTTRVWNDVQHYQWLNSLAFPKVPPENTLPSKKPCPFGCGTCGRHERKGTLLEIEVTKQCNLRCPVCFMSAENGDDDPSFEEISAMFDTIEKAVGIDGAIQLTGGEPTCRKDLPAIISLGREKGFWGIELNTNGLVIASRDGYLEELKAAGLTGVYLSFDGLKDEIYRVTCGRDLLDVKLKAIQRCREADLQVVLAATIVAGLNQMYLGDLLRFCLENNDVVVGLALQPAFTSGRFEAKRSDVLTMGDVIFDLAQQSEGLIEPYDIWPLGCSHPLCDTGTFLVKNPEGSGVEYYPVTRSLTREDYLASYDPRSPQGSVFHDILAKSGVSGYGGLSLIIMNYMDVFSLDVQRLRECSMMVAVPDGRTIPFCSYHLTDAEGKRIYPPWGKD